MEILSSAQTYFVCLGVCILAAWAVQVIDDSDSYYISLVIFAFGLLPFINLVIAAIAVFVFTLLVLGAVASIPKIVRHLRK